MNQACVSLQLQFVKVCYYKLPHFTAVVVSICFFAVIFSVIDSVAKLPELHYPTLKFEDVGGNEETLVVSTIVFAALSVANISFFD